MVLLVGKGELPIGKLQKGSHFTILVLKNLDPEPQGRHYVLFRRAFSIPGP